MTTHGHNQLNRNSSAPPAQQSQSAGGLFIAQGHFRLIYAPPELRTMHTFQVEVLPAGDLGIVLTSKSLFTVAMVLAVMSAILNFAAIVVDRKIRE